LPLNSSHRAGLCLLLPHTQLVVLAAKVSRDHNRRMTKNIMPVIPGEYLSPGRYWLPSPETARDSMHEVQCSLPRFGAVRITYQRMTHRRGRMRSWFWTPVHAEQTGEQG
jgi:hypothetical protein